MSLLWLANSIWPRTSIKFNKGKTHKLWLYDIIKANEMLSFGFLIHFIQWIYIAICEAQSEVAGGSFRRWKNHFEHIFKYKRESSTQSPSLSQCLYFLQHMCVLGTQHTTAHNYLNYSVIIVKSVLLWNISWSFRMIDPSVSFRHQNHHCITRRSLTAGLLAIKYAPCWVGTEASGIIQMKKIDI